MLSPSQINFDDKNYEQLLKEAMEQLPKLCKEWTDYNPHDPGITFLELLTWLTETQRYYLNEITDTHRLKYLKLLGVTPKRTEPLRLPIVFSPCDTTLRQGEQAIIGGMEFTLEEETVLTNTKITLKHREDGESELAYGFSPFGFSPQNGSSFYICFDNFPHKRFRLYVKLMQSKEFERTEIKDEAYALARLRFEVFSEGEWLECKVTDKTYGFMQSGEILIEMPKTGSSLRCSLVDCKIDIPPIFEQIYYMYAELVQYKQVYGDNNNAALVEKGHIVATLKPFKNGYIKTSDNDASLIIYADEAYRQKEYTIENNKISLGTSPLNVIEDDFSILVCGRSGIYREWKEVSDFSCSLPFDRHYVLDSVNGLVQFGDNVHGRGAKSAIVRSLKLTHGNVSIKENNELTIGLSRAKTPFSSRGGNRAETPCEAFERFNKTRHIPYRAITSTDYRDLVLKTPCLCIKNVNVYSPEDGVVEICVKTANGKLTSAYVNNIRRHLYDRRLPCTELRIKEPSYFECDCYVKVLPKEWAIGKISEIKKLIFDYFESLENEFGLKIAPLVWMQDLEGFEFIKKVEMFSIKKRTGETILDGEEITLPQNGLLKIVNKEVVIGK